MIVYANQNIGDQVDTSTDAQPGDKLVSAHWQTSINAAGQCGQILGLYLVGWISDRFGYKKTMFGALILMAAFIFIPFFAQNIQTFVIAAVFEGVS